MAIDPYFYGSTSAGFAETETANPYFYGSTSADFAASETANPYFYISTSAIFKYPLPSAKLSPTLSVINPPATASFSNHLNAGSIPLGSL
jgi:hypothetical protein